MPAQPVKLRFCPLLYISLKIDDPSLPAPLFANLFAAEDGKTFQAIWSRSKGRQQGRQQSRRD
ncbi:DUF736 domain-containing protein [Methylobacterium sp. J-043]|nr:DUF736 domain-containing protein [Methylobacterium sp. J-043]